MIILNPKKFSFEINNFTDILHLTEGEVITFFNSKKEVIAHLSKVRNGCYKEYAYSFNLGTKGRWSKNTCFFKAESNIEFEILDKNCISINGNKIISKFFIDNFKEEVYVVIGKRKELEFKGNDLSIHIDINNFLYEKLENYEDLENKKYQFDFGFAAGVGDIIWGLCNKKHNLFLSNMTSTKRGRDAVLEFYSDIYHLDMGYLKQQYYDFKRFYTILSEGIELDPDLEINFCGQNVRLEAGIPFTNEEIKKIRFHLESSNFIKILDFNHDAVEVRTGGILANVLSNLGYKSIQIGEYSNFDTINKENYIDTKDNVVDAYRTLNSARFVYGEACGFNIYASLLGIDNFGVLYSGLGGLSLTLGDFNHIKEGKTKIHVINLENSYKDYGLEDERLRTSKRMSNYLSNWKNSYHEDGNVICPVCFCKQKKEDHLQYECNYCGVFVTKTNNKFEYNDNYLKIYDTYTYEEMNKIRQTFITNGKTILDYGCGKRHFVNHLLNNGYNAYGYDVVPNEENLNWRELFDRTYDYITFFDSLEHIENIHQELIPLLCLTKKVIITIPNVIEEATLDDIKKYKHYKPGEHILHFKRKTLEILMSMHGFSLESISFIENDIRKFSSMGFSVATYIFKDSRSFHVPFEIRPKIIKDYFKYEKHFV